MAKKDFGVIVICTRHDLLFAKGCCASIRFFMPDVPICLLTDGEFDLQGLDKVYNAFVLCKLNIKNEFLKNESFGWGTTRMIAFWESPFEYFLLIDSDICVWGDIRKLVDFDSSDIFIDDPQTNYSHEDTNEFFFDTERFKSLNTEFNYEQYRLKFVCPAVLFARRNCFPIEEYRKVLAMHKSNPGIFKYGDMGFFNYMIFDLADKQKIRLKQIHFQYLVPDYPVEATALEFNVAAIGSDKISPMVVHWCGSAKPVQISKKGWYTELMTHFRRQFFLQKGRNKEVISFLLNFEDWYWQVSGQIRYYKRRLKSIIKI